MRSKRTESACRSAMRRLGQALVTGAADDDPAGVATCGGAGAGLGYALGWTLLFCSPPMVAIQASAARIGAVTGAGIAA